VNPVKQFLEELRESLANGTFRKLTLGKFRGECSEVEHVYARLVDLKEGQRLSFVYQYPTNDLTKNYSAPDAIGLVRDWLGESCLAASLFTSDKRYQLLFNRRGKPRLHCTVEGRPDHQEAVPLAHDRSKQRLLQDERFLQFLDILDPSGKPRRQAGDKYRQVHQFIASVAPLLDSVPPKDLIRVVDMGCGKGYLTFALHRYLQEQGLEAHTIGIERRAALTDAANAIVRDLGYTGIKFQSGEISESALPPIDLLVALHACDTATDEAIFRGIVAQARWIIVSPCCQHELRPQLQSPSGFEPLFRFGIQVDRLTEAVTDALRCLYLEAYGYMTRLQEFIDPEHTARNLLLIATKSTKHADRAKFLQYAHEFQARFGIEQQRLATLLASGDLARIL
jgi:SAM-dependent methyltransferase